MYQMFYLLQASDRSDIFRPQIAKRQSTRSIEFPRTNSNQHQRHHRNRCCSVESGYIQRAASWWYQCPASGRFTASAELCHNTAGCCDCHTQCKHHGSWKRESAGIWVTGLPRIETIYDDNSKQSRTQRKFERCEKWRRWINTAAVYRNK